MPAPRSSRGRSSQQPPTALRTNSTSSTHTTQKDSARLVQDDRIRSNSPRTFSQTRSELSADRESMSRSTPTDQLAPRRSRRGAEPEQPQDIWKEPEDDEDNDALEEEITRCICGQAEYPGISGVPDDNGNFFVQCDNCHVWQHGGCVGLMNENMLPENAEYYCDICRPEFHKIIKAANSTKSSRYLPVLEPSSRSTPIAPGENVRGKDAKNKSLQSTKRRATMNSRGAYDEDEALRRAIEESKYDGTLGKRGRDESQDARPGNKRQKTTSSGSSRSGSQSPDPAHTKSGSKLRGAAARNNREKELREKQKQEAAQQRAEAASKRNARSERRRADDSPPPTPTLSPSKVAQNSTAAQRSKAETPPISKPAVGKGKGGARPGVRGRRLGRNQYTRDQDGSDTPHRDTSHDRLVVPNGSPYGNHSGINGESGRSSKPRTHPARTSLNEMKKRVAGISEFVSQMQIQVSSKSSSKSSSKPDSNGTNTSDKGNTPPNGIHKPAQTSNLAQAVAAGLAADEDTKIENEETTADDRSASEKQASTIGGIKILEQASFGNLNSQEMMNTLMTELVEWQTLYGHYSR